MLKKISAYQVIILSAFAALLFSCHKDEVKTTSGKLTFSFNVNKGLTSGRTAAVSASYLVISVEDASGATVYDRKKIELYTFGSDYLSEPVEFKTGSFKLTEFFVTDKNDSVIYATPLEGSKLAYLVDDPLPIDFTITKDQTIKVVPEVIAIDQFNSAGDFGYSTFSFNVVQTLSFQVGVFVYDDAIKNFKLTNSTATVTANNATYYNKNLPDSTVRIVVKANASSYTLAISKTGYQTYSKTFSADSLLYYTSSNVLKVILLNNSLSQGLVAFYPFSGNALDLSGNNLNGIVHGATLTTDRKGTPNSAYFFDGVSNYISVPNNNLLNFTGDFSISLWTLVDSAQVINNTNLNINNILRKWNGDAQGYPFSISYLNSTNPYKNRFLFVRYDGSYCLNTPALYSPQITNFSFTNITFIKQGNVLSQYINGVLIQQMTDTTSCGTSNTADMTIGCLGNLLRFFKGKIDDIRMYNRALSASEIVTLNAE